MADQDHVLALDSPELASAVPALRRVRPPPKKLLVRGTMPPLDQAVAIVGTRAADADALDFIRSLATELARAGCVIVSGGAVGIDAAAHRGALDAGRPTLVVLPWGLDDLYPAEHAALFADVLAAGGALVCEPGPVGQRGRFLARNRLIAALSRVVIVGQAPARSGALSTARVARQVEIPLMAVPYAPWDPRGAGCLGLLRSGAAICTSARDALSVPALDAGKGQLPLRPVSEKPNAHADLAPDGVRILEEISGRPLHPDEIAHRLALPAEQVQRTLLALVLRGLAEPRPGGRFGRTR